MFCRDCGGFRDIRWVVNWSAVFVETVFESSFGFTHVLFEAVVALHHFIRLDSPVEWNLYELCPSDMYFQVRQFFLRGYEPRGWLCCVRLRSLALTRKSLRLLLRLKLQ